MSHTGKHPIGVTDTTKWPTIPTTGDHADNLLASRLTTLEAGAGTGGFYFVRKTADEAVTSSTTVQSDDQLSFPIGANETWEFECDLLASGATTGDLRVAWNVPSGATGEWGVDGPATGVAAFSGDSVMFGYQAFGDSNFADVGLSQTASPYTKVKVEGTVVNGSTAGTVVLRWAQRASDATATTVRAGSKLKATRVSPIQPAGANYGAMQLVQRQVLAAAAQDITFTGLDLSADGMYLVQFALKNATGTAQNIALYYNGDTTATNYRRNTGTGSSANDASITTLDTAANGGTAGVFEIYKPATGERTRAVARYAYGPYSTAFGYTGLSHIWTTVANVTSFTLRHPTASGFDVGTEVKVYRLAPVPLPVGVNPSYRLHSNVTPAASLASNPEQDLMTYSLPASTLRTDGQAIRITMTGTCVSSSRSKTVRVYFGAAAPAGLVFGPTTSTGFTAWQAKLTILRTGAATQIINGIHQYSTIAQAEGVPVAATETLANAITIKATATVGGAAVAGDITMTSMVIEFLQ